MRLNRSGVRARGWVERGFIRENKARISNIRRAGRTWTPDRIVKAGAS